MRFPFLRLAAALFALALLGLSAPVRAQLTFNFQFDATSNNTITPPIVGTGTLTLATDPGDGTFAYTDLNPVYSFTFGEITFTQDDIASNPSLVRLVISTTPEGRRRLQFSDIGPYWGGGGGGPLHGSLDLVNGSDVMAFSPRVAGDLTGYHVQWRLGTYLALENHPETLIGKLIDDVVDYEVLPDGIKNSFVVKLEAALSALEAGDTAGAIASLQDFINQAQALIGRKLPRSDAMAFIGAAQDIIDLLVGP